MKWHFILAPLPVFRCRELCRFEKEDAVHRERRTEVAAFIGQNGITAVSWPIVLTSGERTAAWGGIGRTMVDDGTLEDWFCREVLPLERSLMHFLRRNWPVEDDVVDLKHDVYELAIKGGRNGLPIHTAHYLFAVARNHLINRAKRARIVSFDLVADLETIHRDVDMLATERHLNARESLRTLHQGLGKLSPRVREVVRLRKIDGLTVQETAERLGIGKDAVNHQLMMGMKALADHMLGGTGKIVRHRAGRRIIARAKP